MMLRSICLVILSFAAVHQCVPYHSVLLRRSPTDPQSPAILEGRYQNLVQSLRSFEFDNQD